MIQNLEKQIELSKNLTEPGCYLANFTGTYIGKEYFKLAKKYGVEYKHVTRKGALVGITGVKKILTRAFNAFTGTNVKIFDTEEEAKEYLIKQ